MVSTNTFICVFTGGSVKQDFQLETRLDNLLIEKSMGVIDGKEQHVTIDLDINNECRYKILKYFFNSIS